MISAADVFSHFSDVKFTPGKTFRWSPQQQVVFYDPARVKIKQGLMALIHEVGHAQLKHQTFEYDIELVAMELAAWHKAVELASILGIKIDQEHVDECMETYRLWLYKRSSCPECESTSLQQPNLTYCCFICNNNWQVADSRTLQPRRMKCLVP